MPEAKQRKVKCIVPEYYDMELDRYIKKDEVITLAIERANYLTYKGLVEPIKEETKESNKVATKKE